MKSKSIIALGLLGVLSIGSIKISAKTLTDTTPKNTLMAEQSYVKSSKVEANNEKLKKVAKQAFEKYFNQKLDANNLGQSTKLVEANDEGNPYGKEYYEITFGNDESKDGTDYYANIEPNGKIIDMGIVFKGIIKSKDYNLISLEEAKKVSADFIKENKLTSEGKTAKFLGEATISTAKCGVVYEVGENTGVIITVDSTTKKPIGFTYLNLSDCKKAIENTDFRSSVIPG